MKVEEFYFPWEDAPLIILKTEERMKTYFLFCLLCWGTLLRAENIVLDYKESVNGFGTVAGKVLSETKEAPFVVTVESGGIAYSTLTDSKGRWGIVFRHLSTQFTVTAKSLSGRDAEAKVMDSIN